VTYYYGGGGGGAGDGGGGGDVTPYKTSPSCGINTDDARRSSEGGIDRTAGTPYTNRTTNPKRSSSSPSFPATATRSSFTSDVGT
jgi:hypothetical protein